jgi:hypothetical protein
MDVAVDLVEVFLRFNGYMTLSEWHVLAKNQRGDWEPMTDVDILGVRFPGQILIADSHDDDDPQEELEVPGVLLRLEPDTVDVIIGEVKQGEAVFNPSLTKPHTLQTVLHRLRWLYQEGDLEKVVSDLRAEGVCHTPARGGGRVRTRLVAFGQAPEPTLNVIPLGAILERVALALEEYEDILRSVLFASPSAATLKLLHKTGFRFSRD